jgi:hypothetical protein
MRRLAIASLAFPLALLLAAGPVAADTTGGGNGTNFSSGTEVCSTSGGRQVCTDTSVFVSPNGDGTSSGCLDIFTFSVSSTGRFTFLSEKFGCNPNVTLTVGSDYSVTLPATSIAMQTCAAHRRSCTGSTVSTVSASDSVVGPVSTTTTRSTTVSGNCTTKTTTNETSANLAGTITINGSTVDEQGFLDIVNQTFTIRCK